MLGSSERVQTRYAGVVRTQASQADVGIQPVPAAHVVSAQQPQSQHPHDLELTQPSRKHQVGHSSTPRLQREVGAAHHPTIHAPDCKNRRSSPEDFRRDATPLLIDASGARRWIVDRIVDHEDHKFYAPSNNSALTKNHVEQYYRVLWIRYSPADDIWEPRSMLAQDILDVVENYESRRKTAIASNAAESSLNLASRDAREQQKLNYESPSDSEIYYEARENLDGIWDYVKCHCEPNLAHVGIKLATSRSRTQW